MERDWIGNFFAKTEQNLKFLVLTFDNDGSRVLSN